MNNQIQPMPQANIAVPSATRLGQGTAVEQSRAVAEVQAAIVVAQQCPRDVNAAVAQMRESCRQRGLADRAFYRFPRAGGTVTGPSVHLARELARCWGNVQYGLVELRRDDEYRQSEMQAWAWDVQTNTRNSSTFVVPHVRDTKDGAKPLTDMRDIYENNANNGSRRVREAIYAILPPWFVEEAKELCAQTLRDGGGKPLAQRIADAAKAFEGRGVSLARLEQKIGRPSAKWNEYDVAQLGITFKSIERGEISIEDEFPPERVTMAEVQQQAAAPAAPAAQNPPMDEHQQAVAEWRQAAHEAGLSQDERDELFYGEHGASADEVSPAAIRSSAARLRARQQGGAA